jgi:hypothetical protein
MSKYLDNALGLNPMAQFDDKKDLVPAVVQTDNEQLEEDVEQARENLTNAIDLSQVAVQDMLTIAQQSQHPKAYEVLNSMIKTYADISMGLVDLQAKKAKLVAKKPEESGQTINNNLFVGSTAELQQMLENMKKKDGNNTE